MASEAVRATLSMGLSVIETLTQALVPAAAQRDLAHTRYNSQRALSASSTPGIAAVVARELALTAGEYVLDLTAAPASIGTQDLTGLRLVAMLVVKPDGAALTVSAGDSNGYLLYGAAGTVVVPPGGRELSYRHEGGPAVSGSAKNIKFVGTGSELFQLLAVFGGIPD